MDTGILDTNHCKPLVYKEQNINLLSDKFSEQINISFLPEQLSHTLVTAVTAVVTHGAMCRSQYSRLCFIYPQLQQSECSK